MNIFGLILLIIAFILLLLAVWGFTHRSRKIFFTQANWASCLLALWVLFEIIYQLSGSPGAEVMEWLRIVILLIVGGLLYSFSKRMK